MDPLSRRSLFGAGVGAAVGLSATTAPAAAREIDPELVAHWTKLLRVLVRHDAMCGAHEVLAVVRQPLDLIAKQRAIARGELRTALLRVEARWSQFAAWLNHEAGDRPTADYWADRSLRLASEAHWPDMVAYGLTRQSRWASTRHDPRRSATLADAGGRVTNTSHQIRALCALTQAHGYALANDAAACERSLADAYGLVEADTAPPWDDLGGQNVTRPHVLAGEAHCWLWLRPSTATSVLEEVLRVWPTDRPRSRSVQQTRLALACAATGEPERAAAAGSEALSAARATRSDVAMRELKQLDRQLAAYDAPAAADFREAFAATP